LVDIDLAALPDDPTTLQHLLCEMAAAAEQRHSVLRDAVQQREADRTAGDPGVVLARRLNNAEYNYTRFRT